MVLLRWSAFLFCWGAVLYGMYAPPSAVSAFADFGDLVLHLVALTLMAATAHWAFPRSPGWLLWPVLLALAVALEYLQPVVQPSRQFSGADLAANLAGVLVGWGVCRAVSLAMAKCTNQNQSRGG